jgi:Tol biopolymer transport system component
MHLSRARSVLAVLVVAAVGFAGACPDQPAEPEPEESTLTISMQVTGGVTAVSVEISAEDIPTPIVANIPVSNGIASGTVTVPAGSNRLITVHAFDDHAIETHRGSKTVNVVAGQNLVVEITLEPLSGEQPIVATVGTYVVTIEPADASIDALESVQFTATVTDVSQQVVQDPVLYWGSLNPVVAEVDQAGLVTGGHAGVTTIVVNYLGIAAAAEVVVAGEVLERIAFLTNRDGNSEIYVMNTDGSGILNLTNDEGEEYYPTWSPSGMQVAFRSYRESSSAIYVANADGSGVVNLTGQEDGHDPTWSPDGTRIAFHTWREGDAEIFAMNADGSVPENLTNDPGEDYHPKWSPDGSRIAFVSFRGGQEAEIYVMNADGSGATNLTNHAGADGEGGALAWSPDASKIAFESSRDGNKEIYIINADGSGTINLSNNAADDRYPNWSPDGNRIVFHSMRDGNYEVYAVNADGSGLVNLSNDPGLDRYAAWSADGSRIVFTATRDGNTEIYVMNADGSAPTRLTNDPDSDLLPVWGRALIFAGPGY